MKNPNISMQIIYKDEERVIKRCLEANTKKLHKDDEIVVDIESSDRTVDIIKKLFSFIRIYDYVWDDKFANARIYTITYAKKNEFF